MGLKVLPGPTIVRLHSDVVMLSPYRWDLGS